MEMVIDNEFNELDYQGYEDFNLMLYGEVMSRIRGYIESQITPDDIIEMQKSSSFNFYAVNDEKDKIFYVASVGRDSEFKDGEMVYTSDYKIRIQIEYMSCHAIDSSFLETANYLRADNKLGFTAY
jgi:hypothetical protein